MAHPLPATASLHPSMRHAWRGPKRVMLLCVPPSFARTFWCVLSFRCLGCCIQGTGVCACVCTACHVSVSVAVLAVVALQLYC
jgi:hypothetical protein